MNLAEFNGASEIDLDRRTILMDRMQERSKNQKILPFKTFNEFSLKSVAKRPLVKNVFNWGETSAFVGPPGSLKSALLASASVAVANGNDWFGKRNKGRAGVVYFALERPDLVKRRLQAHGQRDKLRELPIAVVGTTINLMSAKTVPTMVATIKAAEDEFGMPVGFVPIDTYAKAIAAGGGDEDKARDQGAVLANIKRIKDAFEVPPHFALVGHTGKDESRGARGSNALLGDVDMMVTISGTGVRTATIVKANDGPEGQLFSFASETHSFGLDEDGDDITVNIVVQADAAHVSAQGPQLTKNQQTMFSLLLAAGSPGLSTEDWNSRARDVGIGMTRKADLYDLRSSLKSKRLIQQYGDRWIVVP